MLSGYGTSRELVQAEVFCQFLSFHVSAIKVSHVHVLTAYIITPRPSALAMPEMRVRMVFTITVQMFFFSVVIFVKFKRMVSKIKSLIITLFIG